MGYTICTLGGDPKPIRIVMTDAREVPYAGEAFTPFWWVCDPCNPSPRRYEITYRADQEKPQTFPWYQVITSEDQQADIDLKLAHYAKVIAARKTMEAAEREWRLLNS